MTEISIPKTAADVDAAWVDAAMHSTGAFTSARVIHVAGADLEGVHGGLMGDLTRIEITWDSDDPALPRSAVLKLPTQLEDNRAFAVAFGQYAAEHGFYSEVAPQTRVRVPRCWYAGNDGTPEGIALLLEDVGHLETVDPIDGLSLARAEAAIDELARLHSKWWGNEFLAEVDWLPTTNAESLNGYGAMCEASLPAFLEATTGLLSPDDHNLCRRFVENFKSLYPANDGDPHPLQGTPTLLHRDFHLGNMFWDGDQPVIYDWGNVAEAYGFYDVVYFLAGALTEETAAAHSRELLTRYRQGLVAGGVEMTDEEFVNWHHVNALFCLIVPLLAMGDALASNDQTDAVMRATVGRLFAYFRQHDVAAVFDVV